MNWNLSTFKLKRQNPIGLSLFFSFTSKIFDKWLNTFELLKQIKWFRKFWTLFPESKNVKRQTYQMFEFLFIKAC
jgi:hypothetical protein